MSPIANHPIDRCRSVSIVDVSMCRCLGRALAHSYEYIVILPNKLSDSHMHRSLDAAKLGHSTLHHFSFVSAPKNIDTQNQPNPVDESVSKQNYTDIFNE